MEFVGLQWGVWVVVVVCSEFWARERWGIGAVCCSVVGGVMVAVGIGFLAVEGSELVAVAWEKKWVAVAVHVCSGEKPPCSELLKQGLVLLP